MFNDAINSQSTSNSTGNSGGKDDKSYFALPPAISLPKGGGAIKGMGEKFSANPVTGTGSMSIPIATTSGRSGFGPQLSVSYDSGAGNGIFGLGWNLSLPSITRKTDKGLPRYWDSEESDVFILSGAEDLVPVLKADGSREVLDSPDRQFKIQRYRPRIEGLFARIERWTKVDSGESHWRSISKDNITTLYGQTAESRIADPGQKSHVFTWLICESYDDKGNAIVYEYKSENDDNISFGKANEVHRSRTANRYLKRIKYGNVVSRLVEPDLTKADWLFEVVFDYGEHNLVNPKPLDAGVWAVRNDPFSSYRSGFEVRTYRLCQRVLMFHHFADKTGVGKDCLVRSTDFYYSHEQDGTDVRNPIYSQLLSATQTGYKRESGGYLKKSLPPLEFTYSEPKIDETVREVDPESLENLPQGLDGTRYQWVDLDGEGLSGILTEQGGGWFYKRNLSPLNAGAMDASQSKARFGAVELVASQPISGLATGAQFLDLAGDGRPDVVTLRGAVPGFYERTMDEKWESFRSFKSLPNLEWDNPNLKFLDLNGDGHSDILITEENCFVWYPSLAEDGFAAAERVSQPWDEEMGPRVVFADSTQSIHLADMSGDGLTDIVRIRNGEVCYWANLGYGRFGAKVTMDDAPWFDTPNIFNQRRIVLADIDGSGTTDILYLGSEGVQVYFNQSGNGWSAKRLVRSFPLLDSVASVTAIDLLGNGTACLVWSSPLQGNGQRVMRYIDLMGGQKPHLLVKTVNNLGAETVVQYAPSTKFYLQDKFSGTPWITKLPFPVHVVERVETYDRWRNMRFSSTYSYHHGYFDGVEREFRGFGRVEQTDVENFGQFVAGNVESPYITDDRELYQPPVKTVTWYHTGAMLDRQSILSQFEQEYFPRWFEAINPNATNVLGGFQEHGLPEPDFVDQDLSAEEWREALRACKGMMLRQEVYELDVDTLAKGEEQRVKLFSTAFHNCYVQRLQKRGNNRHGVFLVTESEAITYHYELDLRSPDIQPDPRIAHTLNLRTDEYGHVLESVAIAYPRIGQHQDASLPAGTDSLIAQVQQERHLVYTQNRFTNDAIVDDRYRLRLPCEVKTYELTGLNPTAGFYYSLTELRNANIAAIPEIAYEVMPTRTAAEKRSVEHVRMLYFRNDLQGSLPWGELDSLGLPYETYKLALTDALLAKLLETKLTDTLLGTTGQAKLADASISGYLSGSTLVDRFSNANTNGQYWVRSGIAGFAADAARHFYLPERYTDAFGNVTTLEYDDRYDLYVRSSTDAQGNQTQVEQFDFRVLAPRRLKDVNGNGSEVWFDVLGMPVAMAMRGKGNEGDRLDGFTDDLANPRVNAQVAFFTGQDYDEGTARAWLSTATARHVYYFGEVVQPDGNVKWGEHPACACGIMREQHVSVGGESPLQVGFEYSDGMGTVLVKKTQAEAALGSTAQRWIATGKTILNNKGKAVKQYEPYFSDRFQFEEPQAVGVTPVMYYDAAGRLVRTELPDGTLSRVEFSPWLMRSFDGNDTVQESAWYRDRINLAAGSPEERAARLAAVHANTPAETMLDSLGREVVAIAHNHTLYTDGLPLVDQKYVTFTKLDIEGKPLWIKDARGSLVMQYVFPYAQDNRTEPQNYAPCYDIAGNLLLQHSMDAGDRWMLMDAMGKPMLAWDVGDRQESQGLARENRLYFTQYDRLHRPVAQWLAIDAASPVMVERYEYQDGRVDDAANLNGQLVRHYDPSGLMETVRRDFKGNVLEVRRRLNNQPTVSIVDWQGENPAEKLETEAFIQIDEFDALNRMTRHYNWHRGVGSRVALYEPQYSRRGTLQSERLLVRVQKTDSGFDRTSSTQEQEVIAEIRYNAKGQKELLRLGNGTVTQYDYDPQTFRLRQLRTTRPGDTAEFPQRRSNLSDPNMVQQLLYTYDPVGNITEIYDDAFEPVFFRNQRVEPRSRYVYDAMYRLLEAEGREQAGASTAPNDRADNPWPRDRFPVTNQTLQTYRQRYRYDEVGNIQQMAHSAGNGGWQRNYAYAVDDAAQAASNRLLQTWMGDDRIEAIDYRYDVHGSMLNLANVAPGQQLRWDYRDMIASLDLVGGGLAHYQYDAGKQRTRKRLERNGGVVEERIYLGGYELYRRRNAQGDVLEEIESLHLFEGEQRVLLVDDVVLTSNANGGKMLWRYQYGNHLGSVGLELDETAQIISYEEFYPYGTSAYRLMNSAVEATAKRYRYTGMERDEESGLGYHRLRYVSTSLGRWISSDPLGIKAGFNIYEFVSGNPVVRIDRNGGSDSDNTAALLGDLKKHGKQLKRGVDKVSEHMFPHKLVELLTTINPKDTSEISKAASALLNDGKLISQKDYRKAYTLIWEKTAAYIKTYGAGDLSQIASVKKMLEEGGAINVLAELNKASENALKAGAEGSKLPESKLIEAMRLQIVSYAGKANFRAGSISHFVNKAKEFGEDLSKMIDIAKSSPAVNKALATAKSVNEYSNRIVKSASSGAGMFGAQAFDVVAKDAFELGKNGLKMLKDTKAAKAAASGMELILKRGGKILPVAGTGVGIASAVNEFRKGNYAASFVEAAGASEIPIISQVADFGSLAADLTWLAKDTFDPEQKVEQWWYEHVIK
jgi:RHS repeat-associated protein